MDSELVENPGFVARARHHISHNRTVRTLTIACVGIVALFLIFTQETGPVSTIDTEVTKWPVIKDDGDSSFKPVRSAKPATKSAPAPKPEPEARKPELKPEPARKPELKPEPPRKPERQVRNKPGSSRTRAQPQASKPNIDEETDWGRLEDPAWSTKTRGNHYTSADNYTQIKKQAYPGYPLCNTKIEELKKAWNANPTDEKTYREAGVDGSIASFLRYLNQNGLFCPTEEDANRVPFRGVGIGGWLVLEPWLAPSLFEQFDPSLNIVDQWGFCKHLGPVECRKQLERHWDTFLTEEDVKTLAEGGINIVRIPVGYWLFGDIRPDQGEPWVTGDLPYLQRAMLWFKRYNIQVMFDLHAAPGSQNGFDNSGHYGGGLGSGIEWTASAQQGDQTVYPNIERTLHCLEALVSMFSLFPFEGVVTYLELLNEPFLTIPIDIVKNFYTRAYDRVRAINPNIGVVIGDSFRFQEWDKFMFPPKYNHVYIDTHIYQIFDMNALGFTWDRHLGHTCEVNLPIVAVAPLSTIVGEWSIATTDCPKYFNGVNKGARWDGSFFPWQRIGECTTQNNYTVFGPEYREFLRKFADVQMDAFESGSSQGWFFWNFKTENHRAPQFDMILGIKEGWLQGINPAKRKYSCTNYH